MRVESSCCELVEAVGSNGAHEPEPHVDGATGTLHDLVTVCQVRRYIAAARRPVGDFAVAQSIASWVPRPPNVSAATYSIQRSRWFPALIHARNASSRARSGEPLQTVTERLCGWGAKVGANVRGHPAIVGDIRHG